MQEDDYMIIAGKALERINAAHGKEVSLFMAISEMDKEIENCHEEIERYRARIKEYDIERKACSEHIRMLQEQLQQAEDQDRIISKLSKQNEEYREEIRELKRKLQQHAAGTTVTVNRSDVDNVEIYFKGWKQE